MQFLDSPHRPLTATVTSLLVILLDLLIVGVLSSETVEKLFVLDQVL
jgi:hypothetical protein